MDWSNPTDPLLLGEYSEPGVTMKQVAASDETVIVTNGSFPGDVIVLPAQAIGVTSTPEAVAPLRALLGPSRPNPFRTLTTLDFTLGRQGDVRVEVFDVRGRRVRTLMSGMHPAGRHTLRWDGRGADGERLASGTYFVRLVTEGHVDSRKIQLLR